MSGMKDEIGNKYGRLTVLRRAPSSQEGKAYWVVECECGVTKKVQGKHLRSGATTSCGCFSKERIAETRALNIEGSKFGRLLALKPTKDRRRGGIVWSCQCDCGKVFKATSSSLISGNTKSCGCLQPYVASQSSFVHGQCHSATYNTWANMLSRCFNKKAHSFHLYGGRGITVCDKWLEFQGFFEDMGVKVDGYTIERVDVNGNYELGNCVWAEAHEQVRNKRNSLFVNYKGKSYFMMDACNEFNVSYNLIIQKTYRMRKKGMRVDLDEVFVGYLP